MIESYRDGLLLISTVIPALGIIIGGVAIWAEHRRRVAALQVLKAYAERGEEPPQAVLASLNQAVASNAPDDGTSETGWRKFAFFIVMSGGFGAVCLWTHSWGADGGLLTIGFGVASFVMAALAASKLVQALTGPKKNAR